LRWYWVGKRRKSEEKNKKHKKKAIQRLRPLFLSPASGNTLVEEHGGRTPGPGCMQAHCASAPSGDD
jgi:hypothetical protein